MSQEVPKVMELKENKPIIESEYVTSSPPKKPRSEKQQKWSRELGKRSQSFKEAKRKLLAGNFTELEPITEESEVDSKKLDQSSNSESKNNGWTIIVLPIALNFGGVVVIWCKWGKYKVKKWPKFDRKGETSMVQTEFKLKAETQEKST